jgi:hypothetical protein
MKRIRFFSRNIDPEKAQRDPKVFTRKPKLNKRMIVRKREFFKMPPTQDREAN